MEKNKVFYNVSKYILGLFFLAYYRPKFENVDVIPKEGPIIVCGNHIHLYDQCLPILSTKRMLHYMAKKEYFDSKMAWFFKKSGCISVDRENHGGTSKEIALDILNNGYALGIYPEGTRNSLVCKDEKLNEIYEYVKDEVEFKKFINEVDRIDHKSFFSFLYFTGCRRGEALALNWEDFDFANAKVRINKSITRKIEGKSWLVTTPKNASSIRTISLPANLLSLLEEYRKWQKQKYPDAIFVFGSYAPFAGTNIDRSFSEFCKKANVERIRIHDLRHSHASFLISKGISVVAIAKRLGHKNIEQTLNTYSHMMPDEDKKLIEYLENI